MSLIDFDSVIRYEANGIVRDFSIPFKFEKRADTSVKQYDLSVYYRPPTIPRQRKEFKLTEGNHYTVSQNADGTGKITINSIPEVIILDNDGENLTLPSAAVAPPNSVIGIIRDTLFEQIVSYIENNPNPAKTTEQALDQSTYETQQLREAVRRAIKVPVTWADNPDDILIELLEAVDLTKAKAQEAKESAAKAKVSETNAANSASQAANSANESAASAAESAQSASAAATSETNAAQSETNAAASAAAAAQSETNAAQSETNAAASAAAAATSETNAAQSETNAAASAAAAATSETNAATSETNAAASAAAAATSETNAAQSETNAAQSASEAETIARETAQAVVDDKVDKSFAHSVSDFIEGNFQLEVNNDKLQLHKTKVNVKDGSKQEFYLDFVSLLNTIVYGFDGSQLTLDVNRTTTIDENSTDEQIATAKAINTIVKAAQLATQKWKPAVNTKALLPILAGSDALQTWLCRVIDDSTAANNGVWQWIGGAGTTDWTYFGDNLDFIDETELTAALADYETLLKNKSAKTFINDADSLYIRDSQNSNNTKSVLWSIIKSTLKTYFDDMYVSLTDFRTELNKKSDIYIDASFLDIDWTDADFAVNMQAQRLLFNTSLSIAETNDAIDAMVNNANGQWIIQFEKASITITKSGTLRLMQVYSGRGSAAFIYSLGWGGANPNEILKNLNEKLISIDGGLVKSGVPTGFLTAKIIDTTKPTINVDCEYLYKNQKGASGLVPFIVDSQAKMEMWAQNIDPDKNDYTHVVIAKGTYNWSGYINLSAIGTKTVEGLKESVLNGTTLTYDDDEDELNRRKDNPRYWIDSVTIINPADIGNGCIGFRYCVNLTNCKVTSGAGSGMWIPFLYCINLMDCYAEGGASNDYAQGFCSCQKLLRCISKITAYQGAKGGFWSCVDLHYCQTLSFGGVYHDSWMDEGHTIPPSNTEQGGWNT